MRLLYVLIMALLVEFPLLAQPAATATVDAWIDSSPADGSWSAGGDIYYGGDPYCDYCTLDVTLSLFVEENGVIVGDMYGTDPNGSVTLKYLSPTIIELNTPYYVESDGAWTDSYGTEALEADTSILTPPIPSVALKGIDNTNPYQTIVYYSAYPPDLYSSSLTIGNQYSISTDPGNPQFLFDQSRFPTTIDAPAGTLFEFQGYLAGHFFGGQGCFVTVAPNKTVENNFVIPMFEGGEPPAPAWLSVNHTGSEDFKQVTYCIAAVGGNDIQINSAIGSINTSNNPCTVADCDITQLQEVNRYSDPTYNSADLMNIALPNGALTGGSGTAQAMEVNYYALWLPLGTGMKVCNQQLQVQQFHGMGTATGSVGCVNLTLPSF